MRHVKSLQEGLPLFKALGSELRMKIIQLLLLNDEMSMNEIASALNITNGALTSHIRMLEDAGIVEICQCRGTHGNRKNCKLLENQILFELNEELTEAKGEIYSTEIQVGHYSDYKIYPTCGIATDKELIGALDDSRYFAHPDRMKAGILWFTMGYVEYMIPNLLPIDTKIDQIALSFEIGSEAPGISEDWPSDITFVLNDKEIGTWTSIADFGNVRGIFTPGWWLPNWNQYGLLKLLTINKKGTYIDGKKISDVNINQLDLNYNSTIRFKFQVREDASHVGGLTLFGKGFGNYNQNIEVRITYSDMENGNRPGYE